MRFVKLGLLSIIAFGLLIWGMTLLFPGVTVLSRVISVSGSSDTLQKKINENYISFRQWLLPEEGNFDIRTSDISFYEDDLFNAAAQQGADTLFFEVRQTGHPSLQGGIGFYQLSPDSVITQLYYVFRTPWYMPWEKLRMMMADKQMGPQMEGALKKLKELSERK